MSKLFFSKVIFFTITLAILFTLIFNSGLIKAATIDELKQKIQERNDLIKDLEKEISKYQDLLNQTASEASTLSGTIKNLDLTKNKLLKDINLTKEKINGLNLEIESLGLKVKEAENNIESNKNIIKNGLFQMQKMMDFNPAEILLASKSLSEASDEMESIGDLQDHLMTRIRAVENKKALLEEVKLETESKKKSLDSLTKNLTGQKVVVEQTAKEKKNLLDITKSKESNYKILLEEKKSKKEAFERELFEFESALKIAIDPKSIPAIGKGILKWPLDSIFITQYFGNTEFAKSGAYNGKGHNGVDFRATIGTPVKASMAGIVAGTGNTDAVYGCYSYGKWIMIKHPNGLSTLYAHLSSINVSTGSDVAVGDIIGYSGNTGYSTGPHLHFGVYATQGVQIKKFETSINCKGATIPIADFRAYLNPVEYL